MTQSSKIYFQLVLAAYIALSIVTIVPITGKGVKHRAKALPGLTCISRYPEGKSACDDGNCNFNDPNNLFKLACDTDCTSSHGADYGHCSKEGFCDCGPPKFGLGEMSLQCLNISHAELYETICNDDCQCGHNRIGGGCNFYTKACECGPKNPKPELLCAEKSSNEYFLKLFERYQTMGIDIPKLMSHA